MWSILHVVSRVIIMAASKESHRNFDISFKLRAVQVAEESSKSNAVRVFNIDFRRVREWCKQKDELIVKKSVGNPRRNG